LKWTRDLGDAFLAQHQDVMDAIQRMRQKAKDFGYLRSNDRIVVSGGPYIEILPVDPAFICVPAYDPLVVFFAPPPGIVVGAAISFGFGVTITAAFRPWGWGLCRFDWGAHVVFINNAPWGRIWANRGVYVQALRRVAPVGARTARGRAQVDPAQRRRTSRGAHGLSTSGGAPPPIEPASTGTF
jgi:hypothetical protein